jgi:hypothetical protein
MKMAITVNLWSRKSGEIKRFLEKYYGKKVMMDEDVGQWIYVFRKSVDAVDMISAIMDNNDKFQIWIYLQVDDGDIHPVTFENHNDIIKGIFHLFYNEPREITC